MAPNTKIEWAIDTWNPWFGCPDDGKRSPACDNCYARSWAKRFKKGNFDNEITRASNDTFKAPLDRKKYKPGDTVFVCSLSDFFHPAVESAWYADAFDIIMKRPDLIWIFLTKRPECVEEGENWLWVDPEKNHWLGVTVENQAQAEKRIPALLKIPAAVRFVSIEPMLGQIDIADYLGPRAKGEECKDSFGNTYNKMVRGLNWVIVGGESGRNARPMHPDWARSIRDQCEAANVPFFFKQWGEWRNGLWPGKRNAIVLTDGCMYDGVGKFLVMPQHRGRTGGWKSGLNPKWMSRTGKILAGRFLDHRSYLEFPEVRT